MTPPVSIVVAYRDLQSLSISDEAVAEVARKLAEHPGDGFVLRTQHLVGPLDVVIEESQHLGTSEDAVVQSFLLWRGVPRRKALALGHIIAEILFFAGHTGVAVALVNSQGRGLSFRLTSFDADFLCREIVGELPSGERAA
jgi:hypothetical protein